MQEISIYLNERAGHATELCWENEIRRRLFRSDLKFRRPDGLEELHRNLEEDINRKVDTIISVGGDGTMHTLIQKLAGQDIGLLVIPGGTANDLANELGTIKKLENVMAWVRARELKRIDLVAINGHLMATNGGLGLGGEVAGKINHLRAKIPLFKSLMKMTGKRIYPFFAATEILDPNLPYYKLKLKCDQFEGVVSTPGLLINNQATLGGSFTVAPHTFNDDGKFNVTVFTHKNRGRLIQCLWNMGQGLDPAKDSQVLTFETSSLEIELLEGDPLNFFGDGETIEEGKNWKIDVMPQSLLVYAQGEKDIVDSVNEVTLS